MITLLLLATLGPGLADKGIFVEHNPAVKVTLPPRMEPAKLQLRVDGKHHLVTLYEGDAPRKAWPAIVPAKLATGASTIAALALRAEGAAGDGVALAPADLAELTKVLPQGAPVVVGPPPRGEDRDDDGIPDRLDIVLGARKLTANKARYEETAPGMPCGGGDVDRKVGVCTDTIVRALRNAGIDLQVELNRDVRSSPRAYPGIKAPKCYIDHRRVRNIVLWFARHWRALPVDADFQPGDVVFLDTLPKAGPDHVGIVSDLTAPLTPLCGFHGGPACDGPGPRATRPLVVNNWTDGYVEGDMDLLGNVPVTHHFRIR